MELTGEPNSAKLESRRWGFKEILAPTNQKTSIRPTVVFFPKNRPPIQKIVKPAEIENDRIRFPNIVYEVVEIDDEHFILEPIERSEFEAFP